MKVAVLTPGGPLRLEWSLFVNDRTTGKPVKKNPGISGSSYPDHWWANPLWNRTQRVGYDIRQTDKWANRKGRISRSGSQQRAY